MKTIKMFKIERAIQTIAEVTKTDVSEVIESLTGIAWDEEDEGDLKRYIIEGIILND